MALLAILAFLEPQEGQEARMPQADKVATLPPRSAILLFCFLPRGGRGGAGKISPSVRPCCVPGRFFRLLDAASSDYRAQRFYYQQIQNRAWDFLGSLGGGKVAT